MGAQRSSWWIVAIVVVVGVGGAAGVGCADRAAPESEAVERNDGPEIKSVKTVDGFTQIRQSSHAELVITGERLGRTSSVSVGPFLANIDSVSTEQVRVSLDVGNFASGLVDVSVTTPKGTATAASAIEVTPFVISATAPLGAHGTYQQPMNLCDQEIENWVTDGDSLQLLAGAHHCGRMVFAFGAITIAGDPAGGTTVSGTADGGFAFALYAGGSQVTVQDITFAEPLFDHTLDLADGELVVQRVVDAGGIAGSRGVAHLDHYTFDGARVGLDIPDATITNSVFRSGSTCMHVLGATIDAVTVAGCTRGIVAGNYEPQQGYGVAISHAELVDNVIGLTISNGENSIRTTVIHDDPATPRVGTYGIAITNGDLFVDTVSISGQSTGISLHTSGGFTFDAGSSLFARGLTIDGGTVGLDFDGFDNTSDVYLRGSTIRNQTQASVRVFGYDSRIDLGTFGDPGHNALSVVSGFALDDIRNDTLPSNRYIRANGTTLNGTSYDGQTVEGPATQSQDYRILTSAGAVKF